MTVLQVFKTSSLWLLVLIVAVAVAVWLHPTVPEAERSSISCYYLALFITVWAGVKLWHTVLVWRLSNPRFLERTARKLSQADPIGQRTAVMQLSLVLGARFGISVLFFGRNHQKRRSLWKEWWERNHESVVWDPDVRVYIETRAAKPNEKWES